MTTKDRSDEVIGSVNDPVQVQTKTLLAVEEAQAHLKTSIDTGITAIDRDYVPAKPSDLIVVVGYTSHGKSYFVNHIARHHAERLRDEGMSNKIVISVIWEQSVEEQGMSDISKYTHIPMSAIASGRFDSAQFDQIRAAAEIRAGLPWWIIGNSVMERKKRARLSMPEVIDAIDWIVNKVGMEPVLLTLDYLQRIRRLKSDIRESFIDIVDDAKDIPYNFHFPAILASQAKRDVPGREWGVPELDDGQETSNLEQSSDAYFGVWKVIQRHPEGHVVKYGSRAWKTTKDLFIVGLQKNKQGEAPCVYGLRMDWATGRILGEYQSFSAAELEEDKAQKWKKSK